MQNELEMRVNTFTNDYYMLELPADLRDNFYSSFPLYHHNFDYQKKPIQFAPVARIYGTNEHGQKCCCHIHGFFPFFYVKCDQLSQLLQDQNQLLNFIRTLEDLYQKLFKIYQPIIYRGRLQEKYDFYGYHTKKQWFLKISIYDQRHTRQLWQLLGSKAICNKSFQCYEGHISYFMQMFSQLNLYGVSQMKIHGFTFRRHSQLMDLFQKINPDFSHMQGLQIMKSGWNLTQLARTNPAAFNSLHKVSSCYLEIDIDMSCILNTYECKSSDSSMVADSSLDEQNFSQDMQKNIKVRLTKALDLIWEDEITRRKQLKINLPVQGKVDISKNVEASKQVRQGTKDPLWINFYNKTDKQGLISDKVYQMFRSYITQNKNQQIKTVFINRNVAQNYDISTSSRNQKLIAKVEERFRTYGHRKNQIIRELMMGERGQLPEWDQKNNSSEEDQDNESAGEDQEQKDDKSQKSAAKSAFSVLMDRKNQGNTQLYRGNFQVVKAVLKKKNHFAICEYCRKSQQDCLCYQHRNWEQEHESISLQKKENQTQKMTHEVQTLTFKTSPPSKQQVTETIQLQYQQPYYSKVTDLFDEYKISNIFARSLMNAQILERELVPHQVYKSHPIVSIKDTLKLPYFWQLRQQRKQPFNYASFQTLNFKYTGQQPPTNQEIQDQILKEEFPISAKTPKFRAESSLPNQQDTFVSDLILLKYQFLAKPSAIYGNPEKDPIQIIIYQLSNFKNDKVQLTGLLLLQKHMNSELNLEDFDDIISVKDQRGLLMLFANIVFRTDPDLLITYDQQKKGISYLVERGFTYGMVMSVLMARSVNDLEDVFEVANFSDYRFVKETYLTKEILFHGNVAHNSIPNANKNQQFIKLLKQKIEEGRKKKPILRKLYKYDYVNTQGRVNLNLYRICEQELKLRCYTLEAVVMHLFNWQIFEFTDAKLYELLLQKKNFALQYVKRRVQFHRDIIHHLNIVGRIIQKSKIYGADFVSMMERGSQFKIEAVMCRVTKQNNYLNLSASRYQVAHQSILQCRAFVMEPEKRFFSEPVLLFDFQSLYPSVMIAYNLCYSTCLGHIREHFKPGKLKKLGVSNGLSLDLQWFQNIFQYHTEQEAKKMLQAFVFVTPNKVVFLKKNVRQGIIPRILLQFLVSRIMIKNSMKLYSKSKLQKLLKQRQFAIKLFMNVMYGYTGASFSGRMPCSQIADSVVQVSRYCLSQAIKFLNEHPKIKGKVIYGDTDSVFFHTPTLSISQACSVGRQLATEMTALFPYPIQMKFQKAFQTLVLVSKKRYYGKSYEAQNSKPKYEGKGLELVRRDGISLTSKVMEEMLNTLIDSKDLSLVKKIFKKNYAELMANLKLENDLTLSKQVKALKYTEKHTPAHGQAAKKLTEVDPMLEPKYGERMKYVVVKGQMKSTRNRSIPLFLYQLEQSNFELDKQYYVIKQFVPPLFRVFRCVDIYDWIRPMEHYNNPLTSNVFLLKHCLNCNQPSETWICFPCISKGAIDKQINYYDELHSEKYGICKMCTFDCQNKDIEECVQWNCTNLYQRKRALKLHKKLMPELLKLKSVATELSLF